MAKVKVYTTISCPYCITLKEFLKSYSIEFEEIDIAKNEKSKEEIIKKTGQLGVPVVEINGQFIVGFDKPKIMKILGIK